MPGGPSGGETSAGDDLAAIVGPLADLIVTRPAADGWSIDTEGGGFVMENAAARGSTVSYAAEAGPPGTGVALTLPEGFSDADVARSKVGLIVQNRDNDAWCIGEVAGAGDATRTCFGGGNDQMVLVVFGAGMNDRSACSAALGAGALGQARVCWYRGGIEARAAGGQPLAAPDQRAFSHCESVCLGSRLCYRRRGLAGGSPEARGRSRPDRGGCRTARAGNQGRDDPRSRG